MPLFIEVEYKVDGSTISPVQDWVEMEWRTPNDLTEQVFEYLRDKNEEIFEGHPEVRSAKVYVWGKGEFRALDDYDAPLLLELYLLNQNQNEILYRD